MDIDYGILNPEQLEAVQTTEGAVRVVASAGSGKTKALTYRFAFLVDEIGISPENIACITFTNKAANEMKERIRAMLGNVDTRYVCTFHSLGVKILREEIGHINWPAKFRIMDDEDMDQIIRECLRNVNIRFPDKNFFYNFKQYVTITKSGPSDAKYAYVNMLKNGVQSQSVDASRMDDNGKLQAVYQEYLAAQYRTYSLDYNDLVFMPLYLFMHDEEIVNKWATRFQYVMVDEYQDVSDSNFAMARAISSVYGNIFVVGDPDQLIYGWRGAEMKYIMDFEKFFPGAKTIYLNKNYRSDGNVIYAANELIKNNKYRIHKDMNPNKAKVQQVKYYHAENQADEAAYVAKEIISLHKNGIKYSNITLLYRAHYLSGPFEQAFMKEKIPYIIHSGTPFFQRKEIKDAISLLRFAAQGHELDFTRAIQVPSRRLSDDQIEAIKNSARRQGTDCLSILLSTANSYGSQAQSFAESMRSTQRKITNDEKVSDVFNYVAESTGFLRSLKNSNNEEPFENVAALIQSIADAEKLSKTKLTTQAYLDEIATYTGSDTVKKKDSVNLMTIHGSKGLEFPCVFVVGMNEGSFPGNRVTTVSGMEEERRLAYVAFTRAEDRLYITDAEGNNFDGSFRWPSRFIFDSSFNNIVCVRPLKPDFIKAAKENIAKLTAALKGSVPTMTQSAPTGMHKGAKVKHAIFGSGIVESIGLNDMISVKFDNIPTPRTLKKDKLTLC